ncbi:hypothetical protein QF035_010455 [Streptomyces umbrinus]|uniref:Uncharacterized protein n=1 Tax=Streptomyces umbrinus TaxID=67370 RepID=A0ABU0TAY7_9ACTN|nr:hypothetical protein [Streptomyces umbrinus]
MPTLAELRDQSVIGAVGTGMNQSALGDVLSAAWDVGKSAVAGGVLNLGLLSGDRPSPARSTSTRTTRRLWSPVPGRSPRSSRCTGSLCPSP